ncbi:sensor histidine kinase [Tritonibacter litoralis]|nr:sensor histidine kinase [Tritonibacter litoralis]
MFAALVAAIVPLLVIAFLYDRYSVRLIDTISRSRTEGEVQAVAVRMGSFLRAQLNRLENIADLPETAQFLASDHPVMSDTLYDFLLLEADSPDVYAIELYSMEERLLATVPQTQSPPPVQDATTPFVSFEQADVIGPVLPPNGLPGWFMIRLPVSVNRAELGYVVMRLRLNSLTEKMGPLILTGIKSPQLVVFDRIHLNAAGHRVAAGSVLHSSNPILPGWHLDLVALTDKLNDRRQALRLTLLILSFALVLALGLLFFQLSNRLTGYLRPLKEGADALSRGDFSANVPENGPGELGSLARAFNHMRRHLRDMINSRVDIERRAALGNMAAGIAHEVRNPLATIAATVYGLKRGETSPERVEMYDEMSGEIERVDRAIEEFLKYARPSTPKREPVLVRDTFRGLRTLTSAQVLERNITLNLGGDSQLELMIDPAHLRQILLNLILNAIQAVPDGGLISLKVLHLCGATVLTVEDNGAGMDGATLDKVMRPFFTTRSGGSGLGLAVTAELTRANGGYIHIDSTPGTGTTVTLTFPDPPREAPE